MRQEKGKRMGRVSGLRAIYLAGDGRVSAADGADSGELLRRPGGTVLLGFWGKRRGGVRGLYIGGFGDRIPHESERIWTPIRFQNLRFVRLEVGDDLLTSA